MLAYATFFEKWYGTAGVPNFFRQPYGAGWALVGDAGYFKDPITTHGMSDAFRDGELLADALTQLDLFFVEVGGGAQPLGGRFGVQRPPAPVMTHDKIAA